MFIELHAIQNFAPSNLNRDDTGNPKDAEFGGVRRARISSQCIKRAIREAPVFAQTTEVDPASRTRRVVRMLREPLKEVGKPDDEINAVLAFFVPDYFGKLESKLQDKDDDERTKVMIFVSPDEVQAIAEALLEQWDAMLDEQKKVRRQIVRGLVRKFRNLTSAPDIALFGRMLAQSPVLNIDAACQVAHALSTHRVTMEMDFWTAVDDLKKAAGDEDAGAGGMGFTGFDSACFYRYARIDWDQLVKNLSLDAKNPTEKEITLARRTIKGFLRALIEAVPSGKQNAFAAHSPPSFLLATVRKGSFAWSLVNAFERPVRARRDSGLVGPSVEKLSAYWQRLVDVYGDGSLIATSILALDPELPLDGLEDARAPNQEAWIETLLEALSTQEA